MKNKNEPRFDEMPKRGPSAKTSYSNSPLLARFRRNRLALIQQYYFTNNVSDQQFLKQLVACRKGLM